MKKNNILIYVAVALFLGVVVYFFGSGEEKVEGHEEEEVITISGDKKSGGVISIAGSSDYYATNKVINANGKVSKPSLVSIDKKDKKSDFIALGRKENDVDYSDRVKIIKSRGVQTAPPKRFRPSQNFDIKYWKDTVLPYAEDREGDQYLVVPRLGIVVPLLYHTYTGDLEKFDDSTIYPLFKKGAALYPRMAKLGERGNALIGAHSSYYTRFQSHYKTIFTRLPELDQGDEVWGYAYKEGKWRRYRYFVKKSFPMRKFDQKVVLTNPEIREMTLYTCIPIGTDKERRIIKADMIEERDMEEALENKLRNRES